MLHNIHHIAIICKDYILSKHFYVDILGLEIIQEIYREERKSYKLDLALNGIYVIELFSFPNPPKRLSFPEATGLRHLAFGVENLEYTLEILKSKGVFSFGIKVDEFTNKKYAFIQDPDELPIELYEMATYYK
jgi:glyoxylase I family protein